MTVDPDMTVNRCLFAQFSIWGRTTFSRSAAAVELTISEMWEIAQHEQHVRKAPHQTFAKIFCGAAMLTAFGERHLSVAAS